MANFQGISLIFFVIFVYGQHRITATGAAIDPISLPLEVTTAASKATTQPSEEITVTPEELTTKRLPDKDTSTSIPQEETTVNGIITTGTLQTTSVQPPGPTTSVQPPGPTSTSQNPTEQPFKTTSVQTTGSNIPSRPPTEGAVTTAPGPNSSSSVTATIFHDVTTESNTTSGNSTEAPQYSRKAFGDAAGIAIGVVLALVVITGIVYYIFLSVTGRPPAPGALRLVDEQETIGGPPTAYGTGPPLGYISEQDTDVEMTGSYEGPYENGHSRPHAESCADD